MLKLHIKETECFNSETNEFHVVKEQTLALEHSLVSISKWEAKWKKPFLHTQNKTYDEIMDYIKCMTTTQNVDPYTYSCLNNDHIKQIQDYLNDSMTATTFTDRDKKSSREIITSELIYYWMVALQIPFECQKWHINRLLTLIKICNIKNAPSKKMSKADIFKQNRSLNEARRAALGSKG